MKWIVNKTFPHPVLSTAAAPPDRDYVNREFQATTVLEVYPADQTARIDIACRLSEESLLALIKNGKAKYATEIHCRETFLRRLLTSGEPGYSVAFARGELHQRVEVSSYVVCADEVRGHASGNFHEEFGKGAHFDLNRGDVLATDYPSVYWVEPNPYQAMGTIFDLRPIDKNKGLFSINLESENIEIVMHKDDAGQFNALQAKNKWWPSLLASICLSALCEAMRAMAERPGEYKERRWFGVISQELANQNIESWQGDILRTAQTLLEFPVSALLDGEGVL